jgi:hypothetical protein
VAAEVSSAPQPAIWEDYRPIIAKREKLTDFKLAEWFAFYERAKAQYASGEKRGGKQPHISTDGHGGFQLGNVAGNSRGRFLEVKRVGPSVHSFMSELGYWGEVFDQWYTEGPPTESLFLDYDVRNSTFRTRTTNDRRNAQVSLTP